MADGFYRPGSAADLSKGLDAETISRDGQEIFRQRVVSPDVSQRIDYLGTFVDTEVKIDL